MAIHIPQNCSKILVQFVLSGPNLWDYPGIKNLGAETPEQAEARKLRSREHPSEELLSDTGNFMGFIKAFADRTLTQATVQERLGKNERYYRLLSFGFGVRSGNEPLPSAEARNVLAKLLSENWSSLTVTKNNVLVNGVPTDSCMLSILLRNTKVAHMPKYYTLGEEVVIGVHKVINTTRQVNDAKKRQSTELSGG